MPHIALILCFVFILYLFIKDYKTEPKTSLGLWVPLIWMMIIGSRMVTHWFTPSGGGPLTPDMYLDGNPLDRTIFTILIALGLIILIKRKVLSSDLFNRNKFLFILLAYCGISILWSEVPFTAFKRYTKAIGNIIMVLVVLSEPNPSDAIKSMFRRMAYLFLPLSIVLIKYYPHLGRSYHRWSGEMSMTGVTMSSNHFALLCMVCCVFFLWNILCSYRNKNRSVQKSNIYIQIIIFGISIWYLAITAGRTAQLCFIIAACIIIGMETPFMKRNAKNIELYIFIAFIIFLILEFSINLSEIVILAMGGDPTISGRTNVWKDLLDFNTNPIIGVGYSSFWLGNRMEFLWSKYWWHPTQAHNGYLDVYLSLGLMGLTLLICFILLAFRNARDELLTNYQFGVFRITFVIITVFFNVTEYAFLEPALVWFIFLLVAVESPRTIATVKEMNDKGGMVSIRRECTMK